MELVAAFACSHAGLMVTRKGRGNADEEQRVYDAYAQMGRELKASDPDAVIVFATDHQAVYPLDHVPAFTIGVSDTARGLGDAGIPARDYPVNQTVARQLLEGSIEAGIDLAFSENMRIDHSFVTPLLLALGEDTVPIVPVTQNCNVPPRPTLPRSHRVGEIFREALAGTAARVAVVGTGGLSHWVGSKDRQAFMRSPAGSRLGRIHEYPVELDDTGPINDDFDRAFLAAAEAGRWAEVASWSPDDIEAEAGNGFQEVRNWLSAAGVAGDAPATTLAYEPIAEWLTGTAVVRFHV